ncbi:hypothetical protein GCM10028778_16670 [Barrientosiimonas marina]|uniref:ABC transporter permease n=1 Tax=Lentibacillus kimchii TaxID=1542911 RepID=A0ABW2UX84_9BACI
MRRQIKGLLYFFGTDIRRSLAIFYTILLAILVISLVITYFLARVDNGDGMFTVSLTGPMYVYCAIFGFVSVKEFVPFSIKMGATRKNLFVSTGVFYLALSFLMAVAASILQELVMAFMKTAGIELFSFLHPAYFLNNTWYTRIVMDTSIMFFFFVIMFVLGLLFYKYGLAGAGSVLGALVVIMLLGIAQGWLIDFIIDLFADIEMTFFYQLFGMGLLFYGISFLLLRRITTVIVK